MTPTLYTHHLTTNYAPHLFPVVKREDYDELANLVREYLTHSSLDGKPVRQELRKQLLALVEAPSMLEVLDRELEKEKRLSALRERFETELSSFPPLSPDAAEKS